MIYRRTDIAAEAHRLWAESAEDLTELPGVVARTQKIGPFSIEQVEIRSLEGSRALHKPQGLYCTLEVSDLPTRGHPDFVTAAAALAELIRRCLPCPPSSALVVLLGNGDITPDALGSLTAPSLLVTRHLRGHAAFADACAVAVCRPGVLGTSGVESAQQVSAMTRLLQPDCVVCVDALAGADPSRVCRTFQVCSSGISPGSGVGNNREALDQESLGVPVVAVGVPTVLDAASLSSDIQVSDCFLTPRSIDLSVRSAARLIGYGIDLALQPQLTVSDIDMLVA